MGAEDLSSIGDQLEKLNVKIIGVGFETKGLEAFKKSVKFPYPIYLDEDREAYRLLGFQQMGATSCWGFCGGQLVGLSKESKKRGYATNFEGDLNQFGGTLVFEKEGLLAWSHVQDDTDFTPNLEKIVETCEDRFSKKALKRKASQLRRSSSVSLKSSTSSGSLKKTRSSAYESSTPLADGSAFEDPRVVSLEAEVASLKQQIADMKTKHKEETARLRGMLIGSPCDDGLCAIPKKSPKKDSGS